MKGLELSRAFYNEYGRPMLEEQFGDVLDRIAVGLCGHGSECFGYDDAISRDHDYEPGFCIFLTEEDERAFGFRLFRAYSKLPGEYGGVTTAKKSLLGSGKRGVHTISEFYSYYTGCGGAPQSLEAWVRIPSFYLAEATNGEVFCDPLGEFTRIRQEIAHGIPEDAFRKRLASALFHMAQAGQYNVPRTLAHNERGAAALATTEFVQNAAEALFLLNRSWAPYYKWLFRAMRSLPEGKDTVTLLEALLIGRGSDEERVATIEKIASDVIALLAKSTGIVGDGTYLEPYAYALNDTIADSTLRNLPIIL